MIASKSGEQFVGIRQKCPSSILFRREGKSVAKKGGRRAAIQQRTQPKDHTSHLSVQGRSPQIYGLEQQGVPVCVQARPLLLTFETLRSPNFASLLSPTKSTLALLTSLWKTLSLCRARSPCKSCMAIFQISYSLMRSFCFLHSFIQALRSPPLANSVTITRHPSSS